MASRIRTFGLFGARLRTGADARYRKRYRLPMRLSDAGPASIRLTLDTVVDFAVRRENAGRLEGPAISSSIGERAMLLAALQNGFMP